MSELDQAIESARTFMRDDPHHVLGLRRRGPIWRAMGSLDRRGTGHLRRAALAIAAAERAQTLYTTPYAAQALALARRIQAGDADDQEAFALFNQPGRPVVDRPVPTPDGTYRLPSWAADTSATLALTVAMRDEWYVFVMADVDSEDVERGDDDRDTAGVASVGFSGFAGWVDDDPDARLAFWEWYLTEAVPRAAAGE